MKAETAIRSSGMDVGLSAQRQPPGAAAVEDRLHRPPDRGVKRRCSRKVPRIEPGDTEESLSARILEEEHVAYPEAIARVLEELESRSGAAQEGVHRGSR